MLYKTHFLFLFIFINDIYSTDLCYDDIVHAVILARGGSKGVKNKNLIELNGVSLLARTIKTIQTSGHFDYIWVSSDSEDIRKEAEKNGALSHNRPRQYALDETTSLEAIQEFLAVHPTVNRIALFQCTSIFLKTDYIANAVNLFKKSECVFSVARSHKLRWEMTNGRITPVNFNPNSRPRRQDWNGELIETGMFYFTNRKLIEKNTFQSKRCSIVEIVAKDALEIDTYDDLALAQCIDKSI